MSKYPSEPFENFIEKILDFRGRTPKKLGMDWGGGEIRALSANNVEMGRINFEKECYLGSEGLYKKWMNRGDCSESDVVMTMEAPLGNIAQIPDDKKYILSQRTVLFKIKKDRILNDYFYFLLSGDDFQRELQNNATGTTAKGIQQKKLLKIDISVPKSLNLQKKISAILKSVDGCISLSEETISKLQKIKNGLMQDLFTRGVDANGKLRPSYKEKPELYKPSPLGMIPKEWDAPCVKDYYFVKGGKRIPKGKEFTTYKTKYPYIRVTDFKNSSVDLSDIQYIDESIHREIKNYTISKDDLYISVAGTIGLVGKVPQELDGANLTENADKLVCKKPIEIDQDFMIYNFISDYLQKQIFLEIGLGGGVPKLAVHRIESLFFKKPLFPEQVEIRNRIMQAGNAIDTEESILRKFLKIKEGLMQDLLTGKVDVKVDKDE